MKPFMRTIAVLATAATPLVATPVFAQPVHSALNGDYALSTQPSRQLAPHWYGYHNWRSRNAYHTRLALHKKVEREQNGSHSASAAIPEHSVSAPPQAMSLQIHSAKTTSMSQVAASTGQWYFDHWQHWGQSGGGNSSQVASAQGSGQFSQQTASSTGLWYFDQWRHWGQSGGNDSSQVASAQGRGHLSRYEVSPSDIQGKTYFNRWKHWGQPETG